jgi:hypothetical protein
VSFRGWFIFSLIKNIHYNNQINLIYKILWLAKRGVLILSFKINFSCLGYESIFVIILLVFFFYWVKWGLFFVFWFNFFFLPMHDLPFWMAGATNFSNQKFYYGASLASSSLSSPCKGDACRKQSSGLTLMIYFFSSLSRFLCTRIAGGWF